MNSIWNTGTVIFLFFLQAVDLEVCCVQPQHYVEVQSASGYVRKVASPTIREIVPDQERVVYEDRKASRRKDSEIIFEQFGQDRKTPNFKANVSSSVTSVKNSRPVP